MYQNTPGTMQIQNMYHMRGGEVDRRKTETIGNIQINSLTYEHSTLYINQGAPWSWKVMESHGI